MSKMTKKDIINWTFSREGKRYSWLANVICCQHSNKVKKMKGLYNLAQQERVGSGIDCFTVSIDGCIVSMNELEKFA